MVPIAELFSMVRFAGLPARVRTSVTVLEDADLEARRALPGRIAQAEELREDVDRAVPDVRLQVAVQRPEREAVGAAQRGRAERVRRVNTARGAR
jgi:hypothetical protein